jgi:hypothetical protein
LGEREGEKQNSALGELVCCMGCLEDKSAQSARARKCVPTEDSTGDRSAPQ